MDLYSPAPPLSSVTLCSLATSDERERERERDDFSSTGVIAVAHNCPDTCLGLCFHMPHLPTSLPVPSLPSPLPHTPTFACSASMAGTASWSLHRRVSPARVSTMGFTTTPIPSALFRWPDVEREAHRLVAGCGEIAGGHAWKLLVIFVWMDAPKVKL